MPITRPPASIALPGRSIIQLTVFPVALAAPPTIDEIVPKTPRRGSGVGGGTIGGGGTAPATTGAPGGIDAADPGGDGTGATCNGASMETAGARGRPGGGGGGKTEGRR